MDMTIDSLPMSIKKIEEEMEQKLDSKMSDTELLKMKLNMKMVTGIISKLRAINLEKQKEIDKLKIQIQHKNEPHR